MALNIKDREVHELAAELARRKGQSMTQVIRDALAREMAEFGQEAEAKRRYDLIMDLARDMRALIGPEGLPDVDDLLYDPVTGLPK